MEKQIDYAEQLLEAMKVVSQAEVQGVQFDQTIQCTITDIKDAENGIYTVNNGSASFIAYSKDTDYKVKDNVLVTIPQGDYNQQKIIIGKYITKNSTPFVYKSPFDYFVDITGNLISNSHGEFSILANDVENDIICPEGPIGLWTCLGTGNQVPLSGYDTLGLKADFMTLLKAFKVVSGNYGLRVLITYLNEAPSISDSTDILTNYNSHLNSNNSILLIKKINTVFNNLGGAPEVSVTSEERNTITKLYSQKNYYFDIDDMYGDPYDFDTYYEQQILFDISSIDKIVAIQIDLYQSWDEDEYGNIVGSFKDIFGDRIHWYDEVFNDELYMDNIYVKDVYLSLGYNESQFDTDKLFISTRNNDTYSPIQENEVNKKNIIARWIHKDESGEIFIIDDLSQIPGAQLNWYRYKLSAPAADVYSGVYWTKLSATDNQIFYGKVVDGGWGCELIPNPDLQQEEIKAILIYGQNQIIRSNQLTFTNEIEVPSDATVRKLDDFYLIADDGLNGVYNFYDNNHKILERTTNDDGSPLTNEIHPQNQRRKLITKLKDSDLTDIEYIKWSIPYQYTMLNPVGQNGQPLFTISYNDELQKYQPIINYENLVIAEDNVTWLASYDDNYVYLLYPLNNLNPSSVTDYNKIPNFDWSFYYKIKETLVKTYTNNAVTCEIIKDRVTYSYTFNFRFGYNSTNGSDYTLMLSFVSTDDKKMPETAMRVGNGVSQLKVHLDIMDQKGNLLDWHNQTIFGNVQVKWDWATCISRKSYENYNPEYKTIDHNNIPEYRKQLADINDGYYDENDKYIPTAVPTFYLLSTEDNTSVYKDDIGAYNDQKDNIGRYINNYLVKVFNKSVSTTPNINLYNPSNLTSVYQSVFTHGLQEIILASTNSLTMDELYVLEVTVHGLLPYDLVSYIPIPLYQEYNNMKPDYIGPDMVRYNSIGETDFYKDPCKIVWIGNNNSIYTFPNGVNQDFKIFIPIDGVPEFRDGEDTQDYGVLNEREILEPLNVYLENNPPYGIQYFIGNTVYYTQPIFCYLNQWPNGTVNKWDGTGLLINEEAGYIMGHSITAGKKENDNTFTGVMLGDLGVYDNVEQEFTKTTGVYGFNHGAISYAFKDDGTALIGKAGHGRIEFDGNKGIIKSSSWNEVNNRHGMLMDLDDGLIKMVKPGFYEVVEMTSDIIANFNTEKEDLYRQVLYKLYDFPLTPYNQYDYSQYQYDLEQLTFYLPNSFYTHEIPVNSTNYIPNKFYIETIEVITTGLENEVIDNPPVSLTYITGENGNSYLINSNFVTSKVQRLNLDTGVPRFIHTRYEWIYNLVNSQLVPVLTAKVNYIYTLATGAYSSSVNYVLPEFGNLTEATTEELAAWNFTTPMWFYTLIGDYVSCVLDTGYDEFETYYRTGGGDHYITIGVDRPTYPLSIGQSESEATRKFRVTWDGYVYAEHGRFTGTIQARDGYLKNLEITGQLIAKPYTPKRNVPGIFGAYIEGGTISGTKVFAEQLEANIGEIGGWTITDYGLYNRQYQRGETVPTALGQIYLSSDNRNNGANSGIYLYNSALKVYPFRNSTEGGYVGWIGETNSGGIGLGYTTSLVGASGLLNNGHSNYVISDAWGSGMKYAYNGNVVGSIIVSRGSLGVGESSIYIDCNDEIVIGSLNYSSGSNSYMGPSVEIDTSSCTITMWHNFTVSTKNSNYGPNGELFEIRKGNSYYWEMECWIPATMQHGIYARFA